jgi:hypothetical protein
VSFVAILKKMGLIAGVAAPEVLTLVNPAMGAIAGTVLQSVVLSEARVGSGNGEAKKLEALNAMQVALPLVLQVMQTSAGKELAHPELLASGFEKLNDGTVDILNAFRVLPKS